MLCTTPGLLLTLEGLGMQGRLSSRPKPSIPAPRGAQGSQRHPTHPSLGEVSGICGCQTWWKCLQPGQSPGGLLLGCSLTEITVMRDIPGMPLRPQTSPFCFSKQPKKQEPAGTSHTCQEQLSEGSTTEFCLFNTILLALLPVQDTKMCTKKQLEGVQWHLG